MSLWVKTLLVSLVAIVLSVPSPALDYLIPKAREIHTGNTQIQMMSPVYIDGDKSYAETAVVIQNLLIQKGFQTTQDATKAKSQIILGDMKSLSPNTPYSSSFSKITTDEGYVLIIKKDQNKPTIILAGKGHSGTFYAAQTFRQILNQGKALPQITVIDYPGFALERGYGEFFYGKQWTHEERKEALRFMGETKMNFFMYSPKDDPYNRDKWRENYPDIFMKRLTETIKVAKDNHVTFSFAMNPGLSIKYSSKEDFDILMRKYDQARKAGAEHFSLQIDDIGNAVRHEEDAKVFKSPAEAHAFLINKVYDHLKTWNLHKGYSICGQMYYIAKPDDYIYTMGEKVYPEIPQMWTGGDVVDDYISVDECYLIASGLKRKPFISDNYPVNDFATTRLFMGPLTGRPNDLVEHVYNGFLQNPMNQEEASKIGLATIADYIWNPYDYNPERSWKNAILLVGGTKGYNALRLFCENNRNTVMERRESVELATLINNYLENPSPKTEKSLRTYLTRICNLEKDLQATVDNQALLKEINPWVKKMAVYGQAGIMAFDILESKPDENLASLWQKRMDLETYLQKEVYSKSEDVFFGGMMELLTNRVLLSGEGMGATLYKPAVSFADNTGFNRGVWRFVDYITDGSAQSGFPTAWNFNSNEWFKVTLPTIRPVNQIHILMTDTTSPCDFIYKGELEYSLDLKTWKPLMKTIHPEVNWSSTEPVLMRAVRLRNTQDQKFKVLMKEFTVNVADRPVLKSTMKDTANLSSICDGRVMTLTTWDKPQTSDSIELVYPKPVKAGYLNILIQPDTPWKNYQILVKGPSSQKVFTPAQAGSVRIPLAEMEVSSIKLVPTQNSNQSVQIRELYLTDKFGHPF